MIDSWDICTTWNVSKEGGLMTTTFFKLMNMIYMYFIDGTHLWQEKVLNIVYFPICSWRPHIYNDSGHFWRKS